MLKQLIDRFREDAAVMRVGMLTGTVVDDAATPPSHPKKERACGLSAEEFAAYQATAAKVGFAPRGIQTAALRQFLADEGIRVYPLAAVTEYLDTQYGEAQYGAKWVWKPLRAADQRAGLEALRRQYAARGFFHERNGGVADEQPPYSKAVPYPVLLTVDRILTRFPEARFFVSDEYTAPPYPDPFLAVLYGEDPEPVVIERWDEPTFRG